MEIFILENTTHGESYPDTDKMRFIVTILVCAAVVPFQEITASYKLDLGNEIARKCHEC